ncbi:MAG: efflux RND transporter periplasmic adaptor subunit [Gammaproteobacteria bacterium]|nr:efflux RND transporter periplasmic adaptor subunit [Gammaproteobacteria bacterium]
MDTILHHCTTPARRYKISIALIAFTLLVLTLGGCSEQTDELKGGAPEVTVIKIEPRDVPVSAEFVGKTASSRRVEIRSRVEGFLENRNYVEGSMVEAGQVLFEMDKKPFEAQLNAAKAELAQQQARMETARSNLKRVRPLAEKKAVAQKELDDAEGFYHESAAAVEQAQARVVQAELDLGYCTITTPVTGLSSYAVMQEGAYVGIGDSLLTYVAQLDPMWVEFSISENQMLKRKDDVKRGIIVDPVGQDFVIQVVLADGSVYPHTGKITFADASLSEATGTFLIRAEVDNPDNQLRPGQFVRAYLKGSIRPDAILIPQEAVQQGAQGSFVWVIDTAGKAEFRPVKLGPLHHKDWFIDEGLAAGDTVVVSGALRLRPGIPVRITESAVQASADSTTNAN